jgi:alpha-L-fucosidase
MTEELLAQEPSSYAMIEWKATILTDGKWKDLAKRMTDFPKLEDGSGNYQPWIEVKDDEGEPKKIYAQAYVVAHILPSQIQS